MQFPSAKTLLGALQNLLKVIPLIEPAVGEEPGEEKLFEVVECYGNKSLGKALTELIITKGRVCLIVPSGIRRMHNEGGGRIISRRFLEVDLLIADRAFYKTGQVAVFGDENHAGVIEMGERVETALSGQALSPWGAALFEDGAAQEVRPDDEKTATGRATWIQSLLIPAGAVRTSIS